MEVEWTHFGQEPDGNRKMSPELQSTGSVQKRETKNNMEEDVGGEGKGGRKTWGEVKAMALTESTSGVFFEALCSNGRSKWT